jgi:predicted MFS family arabinose efflux permease
MSNSLSKQTKSLFRASCVAMFVTAMTASIRAGVLGDFVFEFQLTSEEVGWAIGTAFWGFTLAMIFAGPLCDILGMKRLAYIGFFAHSLGIILTLFASGFWSLFAATLLVGIGNGMVEGYVNPLVTAIYPEQKIKMINIVHLWFPVGLVIGGLVSFFIDQLIDPLGIKAWQIKIGLILIPIVIYIWMFKNIKFPVTERVAKGISTKQMFLSCLNPLFLIILFLMTFTSITEWGPNQWIESLLQSVASPILVLVWIGTIMAIGRAFAGPVLNKLTSTGLLWTASIFSCIGLLLLAQASGGLAVFLSATIFAIGITYFWPTMLGFVNENIPKSGALGLAIVGGWGMLAANFAQPLLGRILDTQISQALPEGFVLEEVRSAAVGTPEALIYQSAHLTGGMDTLNYIAYFPAFLILAFGLLYLYVRKRNHNVRQNNSSTGRIGHI